MSWSEWNDDWDCPAIEELLAEEKKQKLGSGAFGTVFRVGDFIYKEIKIGKNKKN